MNEDLKLEIEQIKFQIKEKKDLLASIDTSTFTLNSEIGCLAAEINSLIALLKEKEGNLNGTEQ